MKTDQEKTYEAFVTITDILRGVIRTDDDGPGYRHYVGAIAQLLSIYLASTDEGDEAVITRIRGFLDKFIPETLKLANCQMGILITVERLEAPTPKKAPCNVIQFKRGGENV